MAAKSYGHFCTIHSQVEESDEEGTELTDYLQVSCIKLCKIRKQKPCNDKRATGKGTFLINYYR